MAWQPGCPDLFIDSLILLCLLHAFAQTKFSLLQTLEKENEAIVNIIKYESGDNFPPPQPVFSVLETDQEGKNILTVRL